MTTLSIRRVNALPESLEPSTLYVVKSTIDPLVELYFTNNDASNTYHIIDHSDIANMLDNAVLANTISIGSITTVDSSESASASISGVAPNQILNLSLPRGIQGTPGPPNTLSIGNVTTGAPGSNATAVINGISPSQTLDLVIPQGLPGRDGNTILNGSGAPTVDIGVDNDYYIDTTTTTFYGPKTNGEWGTGIPLGRSSGAGSMQSIRAEFINAYTAPIVGTLPWYFRSECTIVNAVLYSGSHPSVDVTADIIKNGTTSIVGGNYPTLLTTELKGADVPLDVHMTPDDYITVSILTGQGSDLILRIDYN